MYRVLALFAFMALTACSAAPVTKVAEPPQATEAPETTLGSAAVATDVPVATQAPRSYPWLDKAHEGQPWGWPADGKLDMTWGRYAVVDGRVVLREGPVTTPSTMSDGSFPINCPGIAADEVCVWTGETIVSVWSTSQDPRAYLELFEDAGDEPIHWLVLGNGLTEVSYGIDPIISPEFCQGISANTTCLFAHPAGYVGFFAPQLQQ
jgi:hypothetical protein